MNNNTQIKREHDLHPIKCFAPAPAPNGRGPIIC